MFLLSTVEAQSIGKLHMNGNYDVQDIHSNLRLLWNNTMVVLTIYKTKFYLHF